ncbi:hypothetical protein [Campylobacter sp. P091]|uniref:hypothetical protein n=1 Tax=Campylobacter sp. P091 TaxID=1895621 RepID=UPI000A35BF53|nr:hypothetical protein [Campylobacter sp. P091]
MGGRVYDDNGSVNDNNVIIKDGATVTGLIYGGYATGGEASKNTVIVDSAVENSNILGGHSGRAAKVNENTVIVRGDSKVEGNITGGGGHAGHFSKEAHNNKVSIEDNATIIGVIKGGESKVDGYTANGNQISIGKDANISQVSEIIGGTSAQGTSNKNNIIIGGSVTGGEGKIGSENNNIKVAGNIGGTVIGGKTDSGSAGNNIINIDGNTQGNIIGGQTNDPNGQTGGNQITANGNVDGNIYGGYNEATQKVQGSNNTITLSGDLTKVTGNIQVGDTTSNGGSGNTLNINTKNPVTLEGNTSGAKTISIAVSNIGANQAAITIGQNGSIDVNNTTITAQLNLQPSVQSGDPIQLFKAEGNASTAIQGSVSNIEVTAVKGGAITYKVEIDPNNLGETGKVGETTGIKEETKTISEGLVAGAAVISIASENAASKGIEAATTSTSANMATAGAGTAVVAPFGSSMGGTSKIKMALM